jgi:hypothetical protein
MLLGFLLFALFENAISFLSSTFRCSAIQGELAIVSGHRVTYLYSADPRDPDHDALMRIGGEAPGQRAHSKSRL